MSLRRRLALTLVLTAVPLLVAAVWVRGEIRRRSEVEGLRNFLATHVAWTGRERCESSPADLLPPPPPHHHHPPHRPPGPRREGGPPGPPPPPVRVFAYDESFEAASPDAPPFPSSLRDALAGGADHASRRARQPKGPEERLMVAVRTGWTGGPCAILLAERPLPPPPPLMGALGSALAVLPVLLAVVLVAVGPIVRRIRRLTAEVSRSADARYETPVTANGDDEISELARAFNAAGERVRTQIADLEARDRTLRAFLADTTHDLMIPLTVLQGHLAQSRARVAAGGAVDEKALISAMKESQYIASLIHNLGAAAKLDAGEPLIEFHAVDLGSVVARVVERHRPVAGPAGVDIAFAVPERPLLVKGDVTLLEQAVSNLVHNAVRYNRAGGHVAVLLEEDGGDRFRLKVVDDGPGIEASEIERLLERHQRGDEARQRRPGGLGLGLHIVHRVAVRHGFDLRLARAEEGGLSATIIGPRTR